MRALAAVLLLCAWCASQNINGDLDQILKNKDFQEVIGAVGTVKDIVKNLKNNKTSIQDVVKLVDAIKKIGSAVYVQMKFLKNISKGFGEEDLLGYIQEQFALLNDKLDTLDYQFQDVFELLDWQVIKVNLIEYESSINALNEKFQKYANADKSVMSILGELFVNAYRQNYNDATLKIYNALMKENAIFQDNLIDVVMEYFQYDYKLFTNFIAYMVRLIQKGINLEIAYMSLTERPEGKKAFQERWANRLDQLQKKVQGLDALLKNVWFLQHKRDVDKFVRTNSHLSNKDMSANLYKQLTKKYFWRKWFVLVHTYTKANDKDRYYENCNGTSKLNIGNKVIVVNSIPEEKKNARVQLKTFYQNVPNQVGRLAAYAKIAKHLFELTHTSCKQVTFRGAIEAKADVRINAPVERHHVKTVAVTRYFHSGQKPYYLIVFD